MEFHIIRNGRQEGPFTVEELSQQGITPESEVWAPGMADWQQAGDVAELTAVLQKAEYDAARAAALAAENQATTGQPYEPPTAPPQVPPAVPPRHPAQQESKKRGCAGWLIAALILAILFATMVFTCPDRQDHEEAIQEVTKEWMGDKIEENLGGNGIIGKIINKMITNITGFGTDMAVSNFLDVKNYVVCSVGRIRIGDSEEKTVSLGIFGHVFTFGKEDLEEAWSQALDKYESSHESPVVPAPMPDDEEDSDEADGPDMLPDSVMGVSVPDEMDTLMEQVKKDAIDAAKKWAKRKIDEIGN